MYNYMTFPKVYNHLQRLVHYSCTQKLGLLICLCSPSTASILLTTETTGSLSVQCRMSPHKRSMQHDYCIPGCRKLFRCLSNRSSILGRGYLATIHSYLIVQHKRILPSDFKAGKSDGSTLDQPQMTSECECRI